MELEGVDTPKENLVVKLFLQVLEGFRIFRFKDLRGVPQGLQM